MASRGYEEERLQYWFSATNLESKRERFSENDVREITKILETLENGVWSRIPRTYIVLRLIGRLDAIESFVRSDCSDTWFPFTKLSLPTILRHHAAQFLEAQKMVCNIKALNLERADAGHGHFPDPDEIPLKRIGQLGKGGSGFVERVISTITHKEYALKLIKRGQTFKKDRAVLRNYEKELANLKKVSHAHRHIIQLVGSYTDPRCVGILFPVADCNLAEFMEQCAGTTERWLIRTYFGCLASALSFLHDSSIRHKDIKPHNILIKDKEPLFTDFGLALDWSELGHSTTLGPTGITPQYGAPEVAACEPRNSSSDIWSLGCVFLELWALLKGASARDLAAFTNVGGQRLPYHSKDIKLPDLLNHIKGLPGSSSDSLPCMWIGRMLERERGDRWSAHSVLECIQEQGEDPSTSYLYIGRCCFIEDDTAESVCSYASTDATKSVVATEISERKASSTKSKPSGLLSDSAGAEASIGGWFAFISKIGAAYIPLCLMSKNKLPMNSTDSTPPRTVYRPVGRDLFTVIPNRSKSTSDDVVASQSRYRPQNSVEVGDSSESDIPAAFGVPFGFIDRIMIGLSSDLTRKRVTTDPRPVRVHEASMELPTQRSIGGYGREERWGMRLEELLRLIVGEEEENQRHKRRRKRQQTKEQLSLEDEDFLRWLIWLDDEGST